MRTVVCTYICMPCHLFSLKDLSFYLAFSSIFKFDDETYALSCDLTTWHRFNYFLFFESSCHAMPLSRDLSPTRANGIARWLFLFSVRKLIYFYLRRYDERSRNECNWENRSSWTSPLGPVGCPFHGLTQRHPVYTGRRIQFPKGSGPMTRTMGPALCWCASLAPEWSIPLGWRPLPKID